MTGDEREKAHERKLWDRAVLKMLNFVPMEIGAPMAAERVAMRASEAATAVVRRRRNAFGELGIENEEREDALQTPEEPAPEPSENPGQLDDAPISPLAKRLAEAVDQKEQYQNGVRLAWDEVAQVFLDELAKIPCDLPTEDELRDRGMGPGDEGISGIAALVRDRLVPILAAKNAEIERLREQLEAQTIHANARQAEIEMLEDRRRHESTEATKTVAALESKIQWLGRFEKEWCEAVDALYELWPNGEPLEANPPQGSWIRRTVEIREKRAAVAVLRNLIDDLTYDDDPRGYFIRRLELEIAKLEGKEKS